jgi:hypothetical protein
VSLDMFHPMFYDCETVIANPISPNAEPFSVRAGAVATPTAG